MAFGTAYGLSVSKCFQNKASLGILQVLYSLDIKAVWLINTSNPLAISAVGIAVSKKDQEKS